MFAMYLPVPERILTGSVPYYTQTGNVFGATAFSTYGAFWMSESC